MQNSNTPPKPAPEAADLFAANKQINTQTMAPAIGMPTVPGYKSSGKIGALALPLWLLSILLVPVLGALLYENLWHFGRLMLFSQMALGALVGVTLFPAVRGGKTRNPVLAGILGALIGAATFAGAMGLEAWSFRPRYVASEAAFVAQKFKISPQKARVAVEKFYSPANTVKFYWLDRAQAGMTMTSSRSRTSSQVSGTAFWVVEGLELLLVSAVAGLIASQFAQKRFSEEFGRWFTTQTLGAVHPLNLAPLLEATEKGDYAAAGQLVGAKDNQNHHEPQVSVAYLPQKAGGILTVKAKTNPKKGLQTVWERELSNAEMSAFWPAFPVSKKEDSPFSSPFSG